MFLFHAYHLKSSKFVCGSISIRFGDQSNVPPTMYIIYEIKDELWFVATNKSTHRGRHIAACRSFWRSCSGRLGADPEAGKFFFDRQRSIVAEQTKAFNWSGDSELNAFSFRWNISNVFWVDVQCLSFSGPLAAPKTPICEAFEAQRVYSLCVWYLSFLVKHLAQ